MTITITLTIDEDNNNLIIVLSELFATVQNSKLEVFGARLVDSMPLNCYMNLYRGCYTVARRYELYVRVTTSTRILKQYFAVRTNLRNSNCAVVTVVVILSPITRCPCLTH